MDTRQGEIEKERTESSESSERDIEIEKGKFSNLCRRGCCRETHPHVVDGFEDH